MLGHGVVGVVEQMGGVQQRFRRNAPNVEASAAERAPPLDARHLQPELRCFDGRDVTPGTSADDHDVLLLARGGGVAPSAQGAQRRLGEREDPGFTDGCEERVHLF